MGTIHHLPPAIVAPAAPVLFPSSAATPAPRIRRNEYGLNDVARSLGLLDFSVRTIVDKLRTLASAKGMPLPKTPRIVNAQVKSGPLVIYSKSRWDASEFDAWLDGDGPHGGSAALPAPRPVARPVRQEMAGRAARIGAVG